MLISTSKTGSAEIVESIQSALSIHSLPTELEKKLESIYPAGKGRWVFEKMGLFQARTVARVTACFDIICWILANTPELEDILEVDEPQFARRFETLLQSRVGLIEATLADGKMMKEVKALLGANMSNTAGIIVENSGKYNGGKDIIMSGTPCAASSAALFGNFNILNDQGDNRPRMEAGSDFEKMKVTVYSADIAQNAIRAANQIHEAIFGQPRGKTNLFAAKMVRIPLDFNWQALNNVLQSIHPSLNRVEINLFENFDKASAEQLGDFFSFGLRSVPSKQLLDRKLQALKIGKDVPVEINDVSKAVDVRVEGGIVLSLQKEFVEYICQGSTDLSLMCLYRWFQSWGEYYMRVSGSSRSGVNRRANIPRYVTSATVLPMLKQLREKFGYAVHETFAGPDELTIMPNGTMACLPKRDDIDVEMVKEYEHTLNGVLETLFDRGIPLSTEHDTLRSSLFVAREENLDIDQEMQGTAKSLSRFSNICIGVDPDFAMLVNTSSGGGIKVTSTRTVGAKAPTALDNADILGYDFAEPGESPNFRDVTTVITSMAGNGLFQKSYELADELYVTSAKGEAGNGRLISSVDGKGSVTLEKVDGSGDLLTILSQVCATYQYMFDQKLVPDVKTLMSNARKDMGYDGPDSNLSDSEYDNNLYAGIIENDFTVAEALPVSQVLMRSMIRTLNDAGGFRGSNLNASLMRELGSVQAAAESMENHTHYFRMGKTSTLANMGQLANYFGGAMFRQACTAMLEADRKKVFSSLAASAAAPSAVRVQQIVLPFCALFSRVIPRSMEIFAAAEEEVERLKPDTSISADDIRIPGLKEGTALMPHQLGAHQTLRRRPKYAVLFIAPGGGKTILGLTDIAAMMQELEELGEENIRPLILCPTNLVANWCDDLHKIMNGWNAIPITSDTVNTWGEERLYDVITQAPLNTIFVAGLSFLANAVMNIDVGGVRVRIRGAVEFINRFNFSYVLLDESHKVKNYQGGQSGSAVHFNTKSIFTAPSIRYARLATGTLVTDLVSDVVGQAALLTPAIFGDNLDIADQGDGRLAMIRRAHARLSNHTAFISYKRKNWAFMLPNPIDTFLSVDISDPSVPNSELHQQVYDAMYKEMLELLDQAAKDTKKKSSGDDDDDDSSSKDDAESDIDEDELEEGDVLGSLLASNADLNMYFQRIEMLLTDPMGDDVARETFEQAGVKEFTSVKVLTVIDRIRKHFEVQSERDNEERSHQIFQWKPGVTPREYDIAMYNGIKYMARKQSDGYKRLDLPPSMTPPPEDPDYWKEEIQGKLIVFTRYTRAANAVYNALPDQYKKVAVLFHGEVGKLGQDKVANLDAFKTNPNVQILIANEQAISEGHNMQMGSRIIRVDTPWSPGVYDQSTARIFRPDVSAAKLDEDGRPGDMKRELVFIDWIMTNKTLEVGKVARLMWKTIEKTQFDEKGNDRYAKLDEYELQPIKMSKSLLVDNNTIEDFQDYFLAKRDLNDIETSEFAEMRKSTVAAMIPLTPVAPLRSFKTIDQFPVVANQHIPDRHGWGLVRLLDWARNHNFSDGEMLKNALHRMPVVTEFGNGIIVGINVRMVNGKLKVDAPISTVRVRMAGTEELISIPATKVHVAGKVGKADLDQFFKVRKPWATEQDRKRIDTETTKVSVDDSIEDEIETSTTADTRVKVAQTEREAARAAKRAINAKEGKPANDGVKEAAAKVRKVSKALPPLDNTVRRSTKPKATEDTGGADMALDLTPTIYNGFIALYADATDPDAKAMKEFDFVEFGDYVYYDCFYYADFTKFLDYVEKKYEFDNPSLKRLEFIQDGFSDKGMMSFNYRQAVKLQSQLKQFFLVRHKTAMDKKHVKAYPMVMEDRLRIMFDLNTNPQMRTFVGKKIPNTRKFGTFEKSAGMWITFTSSVPKAKTLINKIIKAGYAVTNLKSVVKGLEKIKVSQSKSKDV